MHMVNGVRKNRNSKTLAYTIHKIMTCIKKCHERTQGCMNGQSETNMPRQILRSWVHYKAVTGQLCSSESCIANKIKKHLTKNQRTSGPVNAHLTPGPGIYFNAFIHVDSPRAGADNPLGTNVDVNRKPLSFCPFVAGLKYSPGTRTHNPLGSNILYNINHLSLLSLAIFLLS